MAATSIATRLGAGLTPVLLLSIAVAALVRDPVAPAAWGIGGVAIVLAGVAVFDLPLDSRATHAGIERRCIGRTVVLPWSRVTAIEMTRSAVSAVTVTGRRHLLAAGRTTWASNSEVPESITIRSARTRRPPASFRPPDGRFGP